jgi:hypothetical protein
LTKSSIVLDIDKIVSSYVCTFRFGLNQLWRNSFLAEQVAKTRKCDEFQFWVFSPESNYPYLWKNGETERQFRQILTEKGNRNFRTITLESILNEMHNIVVNEEDKSWLKKMNGKYRIT